MNNQRGVAYLMVLTSIVILSAVMISFTFDSQVNKFKSINIQDRSQARLNAESGLQFALFRLELYQQAFNLREKNQGMKDSFPINMLNQIWDFPFMFPIPAGANIPQSIKGDIEKFNKTSLIQGNIVVSIKNITNRFNLSGMRASRLTTAPPTNGQGDPAAMQKAYRNQFDLFITRLLDAKRNKDPNFDPTPFINHRQEMLGNLSYYMNEQEYPNFDYFGAQNEFFNQGLSPKYGPLSSISELYMLPFWSEEFVDLIKDDITVHTSLAPNDKGIIKGMAIIDLNQISPNLISFMFNDYNGFLAQEFARVKKESKVPVIFNSEEDFMNFMADQMRLNKSDVQNALNNLSAAGIRFSYFPSLFEVTSTGSYGRTTYTLKSIVATPAQIPPTPAEQCTDSLGSWDTKSNPPACICPPNYVLNGNACSNSQQSPGGQQQPQPQPQLQGGMGGTPTPSTAPVQLLPPTVLELFVL